MNKQKATSKQHEKFMRCEKCDARVEKSKCIKTQYPDLESSPFKDLIKKFDKKNKLERTPARLYHKREMTAREFGFNNQRFGRPTILCGPMRDETIQEEYVHWLTTLT